LSIDDGSKGKQEDFRGEQAATPEHTGPAFRLDRVLREGKAYVEVATDEDLAHLEAHEASYLAEIKRGHPNAIAIRGFVLKRERPQ
jgi:hypothetical protein